MADNSDDEAAVVLLSLIGEVIAQRPPFAACSVSADSRAHADLHHDLASVARLVPCENDEAPSSETTPVPSCANSTL